MPDLLECPSADRLQQLALGLLGDPEIDLLSSHILECSRCAETIADLSARDTLADALRACPHAADAVPRGGIVERLIAEACRLSPAKSDTGSLDTSPIATESSHDDAVRLDEKSNSLRHIGELLSPPQKPDELGRLGPYRILKLLDSGGMGMVFLAEDVQLQRQVALKAMKPGLATSTGARQRFLREARAAAALRHDNIVTIYHVGEDRGTLWLMMELLEGESLDSRLKREIRLPAADAVRIGRQIAEALAAAHSRGLIHRDIKPGNVWLEAPTGRVKVLDFGLARVESDDAQVTQSGMVVGTPAYMAPEQARGDGVDQRSDLFSLGCVLYRVLTGVNPFRGKDTMATLMALATHTPPPVREIVADVPAALNDLVGKLLAKDPQDRPQTATEVVKALVAIDVQLAATAELTSRDRDVVMNVPAVETTGAFSRLGHSFAATATVAAAALAIALGIFLTVRTPYGEVVVELGPGVRPDDVQIEVKGNSEVQLADAKHGWTIDVQEGRYHVALGAGDDKFEIDRQTVTVRRNEKAYLVVSLRPGKPDPTEKPGYTDRLDVPLSETRLQQSVVDRKPFYENDFSDWLPGFPRPKSDEQNIYVLDDGHYSIDDPADNAWRYTGCVDWLKAADIEIAGRATKGCWGFYVWNNDNPPFGVIVGVTPGGKIEAWRVIKLSRTENQRTEIDVHSRPIKPPRGNAFDMLRALFENGQIRVWLNDEEACDPIKLPDPMPLMRIGLSGHNRNTGGIHCEFDSIRAWRAGDRHVPPLSVAATRQPFYENDFSASTPAWLTNLEGQCRCTISDGRLHFESLGIGWATRANDETPWIDTAADLEIVGRATSGRWGFTAVNGSEPRRGVMVAVDKEGQIDAWRIDVLAARANRTRLVVTNKRPSQKRDGSYSVLRANLRDRSIAVWIDGEPACEDIPLDSPLNVSHIGLAGTDNGQSLFDCEFDSIRIWRAGEAPPVKPLPVPTASQPLYENDFSASTSAWEGKVAGEWRSSISGGRLHFESLGISWRALAGDGPWIDSAADVEVVGRAASGLWGFSVVNGAEPRKGVNVAVDRQGQVKAWRVVKPPDKAESNTAPIEVKNKRPVSSQEGSYSVLRANIRDRSIAVWIDGVPACDDIPLDAPLGMARVSLLGVEKNVGSIFNCEFDSFRIWQAGEGPRPAPLTERDKARNDGPTPPLYAMDFSAPDPKWLVDSGDDETKVAIHDGRLQLKYDRKWRLWSDKALPWVESADIEIVGRSATGSWGFAVLDDDDPRNGLMLGLNRRGKVAAWRIVVNSPGAGDGNSKLTPVALPDERTASNWNPDGAFNTLRAIVRDKAIDLWVNGKLVCEKIELPIPMQRMHIALAGVTLVEPVDCEFDSLKIWRAGEGPPLTLRPTTANPFFEKKFEAVDRTWLSADDEIEHGGRVGFVDGRFVLRASTGWHWHGDIGWTDSADVEVVGRAVKGSWGLTIITNDDPIEGIELLLNPQGQIECRRGQPRFIPIPVHPKPVQLKGNGEPDLLRAVVRGDVINVWVNGEPACDLIKLPDPIRWMTFKLAGRSVGGMNCEFQSIRVWRAGERVIPDVAASVEPPAPSEQQPSGGRSDGR